MISPRMRSCLERASTKGATKVALACKTPSLYFTHPELWRALEIATEEAQIATAPLLWLANVISDLNSEGIRMPDQFEAVLRETLASMEPQPAPVVPGPYSGTGSPAPAEEKNDATSD